MVPALGRYYWCRCRSKKKHFAIIPPSKRDDIGFEGKNCKSSGCKKRRALCYNEPDAVELFTRCNNWRYTGKWRKKVENFQPPMIHCPCKMYLQFIDVIAINKYEWKIFMLRLYFRLEENNDSCWCWSSFMMCTRNVLQNRNNCSNESSWWVAIRAPIRIWRTRR